MKILLVRPWGVADEIIPPIGLGYLAGAVRGRHEARILDCLKDDLRPDNIDAALSWRPDVVGITLFSKDLAIARRYLERVKALLPSAVTLVGGAHPSCAPETIFDVFPDDLDYAFAGEAETTLPVFLDALESGSRDFDGVAGLIRRVDGAVRMNPTVCPAELDRFSCAWDMIPPGEYPPLPHGAFYRGFPIAPVIVTRGCPFHCTFCSGHLISGRRTRSRSVAHVIDEWARLIETHGVREFHIEDDNFTGQRKFVQDFCRAILEKGWKISWTCPNGVRLDTLDEETLSLMKQSGCYILSVGIESGSDRVLKLMRKNLDTRRIREKIALIHGAGIKISGFFLIGFPGETREEMMRTFRFSRELPLVRATYSYFQPFPSNEASSSLARVDFAKNDLCLHHVNYLPEGLTEKEIHRLRRNALLRFYLRPRVLADFIGSIRNLRHLKGVARRATRWLKA